MPRATRSAKLDTRSARLKLPRRSAPYFVKLHQGLQLGYARGQKGGSWIARRYIGRKRYQKDKLALADDLAEADGVAVLDFWQAQDAAKAWAEHARLAAKGLARRGPYTVAEALGGYLDHLSNTKGDRAAYHARSVANAHIVEPLGSLLVSELSPERISRWRNQVGSSPRLVRGKSAAPARASRLTPESTEARRKRQARANRILTVLKAALNYGFHSGQIKSDEAWRRVKPFSRVDIPVVRYLSSDEVQRLTNACEPAVRSLVKAALLTGCRYGELTRCMVGDVNFDSGTLAIRESKSGKPRHVVLADEGHAFFAALTAGKSSDELVFVRPDGRPWAASHQQRPLLDASARAKVSPAATFHILRHTYASTLAMKGVPMGVIAAQLGHSDTRMTERHYAHLAPSYVAETIRAALPSLGSAERTMVHRIAN